MTGLVGDDGVNDEKLIAAETENDELVNYLMKLSDKKKRLRDLLEEVRQLLDDIYAEDIVSSDDLGKVYKKIERELGE